MPGKAATIEGSSSLPVRNPPPERGSQLIARPGRKTHPANGTPGTFYSWYPHPATLYIPPTYPATLTLSSPLLLLFLLSTPWCSTFLPFFLSFFFLSFLLSFQPSPEPLSVSTLCSFCFAFPLFLSRPLSFLPCYPFSRSHFFLESLASAYCLFNSVSGSPRLLYRATGSRAVVSRERFVRKSATPIKRSRVCVGGCVKLTGSLFRPTSRILSLCPWCVLSEQSFYVRATFLSFACCSTNEMIYIYTYVRRSLYLFRTK